MIWDSRQRRAKLDKGLAKMTGGNAEVENCRMERNHAPSKIAKTGLTRVMGAAVSHSTISPMSGKKTSWWENPGDSQSANPVIGITRKRRRMTRVRPGDDSVKLPDWLRCQPMTGLCWFGPTVWK